MCIYKMQLVVKIHNLLIYLFTYLYLKNSCALCYINVYVSMSAFVLQKIL